MNRRDLLTLSALALGTLSLSGCADHALEAAESKPPAVDDVFDEAEIRLPVRGRFDVAEDGVHRVDGETFDGDAFTAFLDDEGLAVETLAETVDEGVDVLELEYVDERFDDRGLLYGLGRVCGGFAALVAGGHPAEKLAASIRDADGQPFGEYEIRREWAEAYRGGDGTAREYASLVGGTVESAS